MRQWAVLQRDTVDKAMNGGATVKIRIVFTLVAALSASLVSAADIAGLWKHAEEPGWIEIQIQEGIGTAKVVRNEVYPERVGRKILKDLAVDEHEVALWRGQVYVERLGEYKNTQLLLTEPDALEMKVKVGFLSRTVYWVRVNDVPVDPVQ